MQYEILIKIYYNGKEKNYKKEFIKERTKGS